MFEDVKFKGTFRSYQQKILDRADSYLADGKINIVAAPGSGKTILGLELIVRLGKPCLIFSPTTTIRDQWGERYESGFGCAEGELEKVSYSLRDIRGITSVTYQALYSAINRVKVEDEQDDFSDIDIFKVVESAGIQTICLDEAHHLQNEWQKALERFVSALKGKVKVISLTATPPYDATPAEWQRYIDVCGEIDEEIFAPELVKQGTLCPHQDYVYFNFPDREDIEKFSEYRDRARESLLELKSSEAFKRIFKTFRNLTDRQLAELYIDRKETAAALAVFTHYGYTVQTNLLADFRVPPRFDAQVAEMGVNFILNFEGFLQEDREELVEIFKKHKVYERGAVALDLNAKLKSKLASSVGKLESIAEISKCEYENLGGKLRLLILTDYIKRENLDGVGSDKNFDGVNVVSAFETVRRINIPVGALSGGLVILPINLKDKLKERGAKFTVNPLGSTGYAEFKFSGDNKEKVRYVGELFESGEICALVGTKSLLGEGWDSPCVNALILASFVGSFMLSNQMRGRAIRTLKSDPDKTANIWHLATVEPAYLLDGNKKEDKDSFSSADFETLTRRFDCFVAPNYESGIIESGIQRITYIRPPYGKDGIDRINAQMREKSKRRAELKEEWRTALDGAGCLCERTSVPKNRRFPFGFFNLGLFLVLNALVLGLFSVLIVGFVKGWFGGGNVIFAVAGIVASIILLILAYKGINKLMAHLNPVRSIRSMAGCLAATLKNLGIIERDGALSVKDYANGTLVEIGLINASERDSRIFHSAVGEMLSAIKNPRYVIIPIVGGVRRYDRSLACPSVLGVNKEFAQEFARTIKKYLGKIEVCYVGG